jgi:hypothetical protein
MRDGVNLDESWGSFDPQGNPMLTPDRTIWTDLRENGYTTTDESRAHEYSLNDEL